MTAVHETSWDLGELLAFSPQVASNFTPPDKSWQRVAFEAAVPLAGLGTPVAEAMTALRNSKRLADPDVSVMSVAVARELKGRGLLFFPSGGPSVNQLYAQHPLRLRDYIPYASYHREIVHERSIEMARFLLSLGATDVRIAWQQHAGKGAKAKSGVDTPSPAEVAAELGMAFDRGGDLAIHISGTGTQPPQPTDLVWPAADPLFKLARDASTGRQFHFGMKGRQSSSVNAEAGLRLEKQLGLHLGGEYKRWEDLTFSIDASFSR